ncbi:PP2C family protein-serine/threonine phosphatase [Streptomyces albipurpureus]
MGVPVTPGAWPSASGVDSSGVPPRVQHPGELPGLDSRGAQLPLSGAQPQGITGDPQAGAAGAVRPETATGYENAANPFGGASGAPAAGAGQGPHGVTNPAGHPPFGDSTGAPSGASGGSSGPAVGGFPSGGGATGVPTPQGPPSRPAHYDTSPGPSGVAPGHEGGDFGLPAPGAPPSAADPRTVAPPAPPSTKVCVACRAGRVDTDGYCENCGHAQPRERDHMELELSSVAAVSDRGLRHHRNEDAFAISTTALPDGSPAVIAIVCDGVSSAVRPDEASMAAASTANELLLTSLPRGTHPQQAMHEAIVAAAAAVNSLAGQGPPVDPLEPAPQHQLNAPACTIVGAISAGGLLIIGWVGDSRAYWVPDDRSTPAARLTEDDSWAAQMVAAGLMGEDEAYADQRAHAITGWLGADAYELDPHTAAFKPDRPGAVVVCTDGLWNYAEAAEEMARVIPADAAERPLHSAQVLVGHALDGGGHDNVTVAILPFAVERQGAGSPWTTSGPV